MCYFSGYLKDRVTERGGGVRERSCVGWLTPQNGYRSWRLGQVQAESQEFHPWSHTSMHRVAGIAGGDLTHCATALLGEKLWETFKDNKIWLVPISHMSTGSIPGFSPPPVQLPSNMCGKAAKHDPSAWACHPPMWETQRKFHAPGLGLAQYWPLQSFWKLTSNAKSLLSSSSPPLRSPLLPSPALPSHVFPSLAPLYVTLSFEWISCCFVPWVFQLRPILFSTSSWIKNQNNLLIRLCP